jgi:hypothetical protein
MGWLENGVFIGSLGRLVSRTAKQREKGSDPFVSSFVSLFPLFLFPLCFRAAELLAKHAP